MLGSLLKHKLINAQLNSFLMEYEARKMGLIAHRIDHMLLVINDEYGKKALFRRAAGPGVSYAADTICMNKDLLKRLWYVLGFPVNPWISININQIDKAVSFCEKYTWDVVVKPTSSAGGENVFTEIYSPEQLINACNSVNNGKIISTRYRSPNNIMIERKFDAKDLRFFVVNYQVVAVLERTRPIITGDGYSMLSDLIEKKKKQRLSNPDLYSRPLVIDDVVYQKLKSIGLNMDSVPAKGQIITLRGNANLSTGGESIDITEEVSFAIKSMVESAVKAVPDLSSCAVDVLCVDPFNSGRLDSSNIVFDEIETDAGMCIHHFPLFGKPKNVAKHILLEAFPDKRDSYPVESEYQYDFDNNISLVDEIAHSIKKTYYSFFDDDQIK